MNKRRRRIKKEDEAGEEEIFTIYGRLNNKDNQICRSVDRGYNSAEH